MSLLLDALKKADRERAGQEGRQLNGNLAPLAANSAPAVEPSTTGWRVFWLLVIVINVAAVAWLLLNPLEEPPVSEAPSNSSTAVPAVLPSPAVADYATPAAEPVPTPQQAAESIVITTVTPQLPAATAPKKPVALVQLQVVEAEPTVEEDGSEPPFVETETAAEESASEAASSAEPLPYAPAAASKGVKLEALVFSDDPARRMVIINGQTFRAGSALPNQWRLEGIDRETLTVSSQGVSYLLPVSRIQ